MPVTNYLWDQQNYLAESDGSDVIQTVFTNEPQTYGNLISERQGATSLYHHYDALGSTRQLTNSAGSVSDTWSYDAWGNQVARTGTTVIAMTWVGEVGYYFDSETGEFWVRIRPLRPTVARWITVDPMSFADGLNPYLFTRNNPNFFRDFDGNVSCGLSKFEVSPDKACQLYFGADPQKPDIRFARQFKVLAEFVNNKDCKCECCEYRQYVTGSQRVRFRKYDPRTQKFVPEPPWAVFGSYGEVEEDKDPQGNPYGHRKGYPNAPGDEYLMAPRTTGCTYKGQDTPGPAITKAVEALAKKGIGRAMLEVQLDLRFVLVISDECTGRNVTNEILDIGCCNFVFIDPATGKPAVIGPKDPVRQDIDPPCGAG